MTLWAFRFMSSNGKSYHYLFKFQEDLHLDERVMQMLSVVNRLLLAQKPYSQGFKARNYAVTESRLNGNHLVIVAVNNTNFVSCNF